MRILRVINISIKTLTINLMAVSAVSSIAVAQSFDYPANSPTIFNRNAKQAELPSTQLPAFTSRPEPNVPPTQAVDRGTSAKPSVFSKLISRVRKPADPIFETKIQNLAASSTTPCYNTGESAYLDSYAQKLTERHDQQVNRVNGYQPTGQRNPVAQVNFNQYSENRPHSILERDENRRGAAAIETAIDSAIPPSLANVNQATSTRLTKKTKSKNVETKKTQALVAEPVAQVSKRVTLPGDAFKQEFDKAYRYINQTPSPKESPATRIAKAGESELDLQLNDFTIEPRSRNRSGDFRPNTPLEIEMPPFIAPEVSEQSPNASAPSFLPPEPSGDFDTFSGDAAAEPAFTISAPAKTSELSLFEALKANNIEGEFQDSHGNVKDWIPPKPSTSKQTLEEELAELSKPLLRPSATEDSTPVSSPLFISNQESTIWWKQQVNQPLHPENQALPINSNGLVFAALRNSPRIQAVSKNPLIRELQVVEADAEFDPVRFVRSQFQDRVDPVGSSLTINDNLTEQFLKENIWTAEAGIRRKLRTGADVNVSQQLGFQNSNSNNFVPQDQGTATLALNVTQPLLRGRGRAYNQAQILIAQSTGGVAWEVFQKELQEELQGVVGAYWQLYLERSVYLQRKRNVQRGQVILDRLNGRRELDSLPAQIARARSSVQTRKTELANAFRNIRNAETEIRRRVADRNWMASQKLELLPEELPTIENVGWELDQVVQTALNHRPEIREAMRRIKIAGVQRDVSENELLPQLSFLVGTYVSALQGESDVFGAFGDQFGDVTPGYSFGLEYELPRLNRAARSRFQQRHLQFKRLQNELEEVIQNVIAESQIALRRITSAIETLAAAEEAIVAARADLSQNENRWESFALVEGDIAEGVNPTTVLDQLLDSQERLSQAEIVYAQAELELKISEVALQRSMGTLLMHQQVNYDRQVVGDTPVVSIQKQLNNGPTPIPDDAVYFSEQPVIVE